MLDSSLESKLIDLCHLLIDQRRAKVIVPPYADSAGYWFGGGNMAFGPDGDLYLVGRYRNAGDSRTGLAAGTRGLELAVFRSRDNGRSFEKVLRFEKHDLSGDHDGESRTSVLSIEGAAIRFIEDAVELYVSTEKDGVAYPPGFEKFLKPGTGVWSIDRLCASEIDGLASARALPFLGSAEPAFVHVKDPFLYESARQSVVLFCSHPFNWTCSGTGYISPGESAVFDFFPRGNVWDVAMSRGTSLIDVPRLGAFADLDVQLMIYDGGECVRNLEQHGKSVDRPRGYSCEELGGAAYFVSRRWSQPQRLSRYEPLFVSPCGTGCSRYVDLLVGADGIHATWQQGQDDGSQPLVMNHVERSEIERVLR